MVTRHTLGVHIPRVIPEFIPSEIGFPFAVPLEMSSVVGGAAAGNALLVSLTDVAGKDRPCLFLECFNRAQPSHSLE